MKLKYLRNIAITTVSCLAAACSQGEMPLPMSPDSGTGEDVDCFTLSASISVPAPDVAPTRAFGDTPDYSGLKLYAIEFECSNADDPSQNVLLNIYESGSEITNETAGQDIVNFNILLNKSEAARVLHLVAVPNSVNLEIGYGTEAYVIPSLYTSGNSEAYWKRIVFENGYGIQDETSGWQTSDAAKAKLTRVPMLRNFARISVDNVAQGFSFSGFAVLNVSDRGSVAPWNYSQGKFPEFLNADNSMKSYSVISEDNYSGYLPAGWTLTDYNAGAFTTEAKYIYERPFPQNNLDRTVLIVRGRRNGDTADTYYKVDLGTADNNGIFNYYNLLRNIDYHVKIKEVGASGYPTSEQAEEGVVYNNFAFDVDTRTLTNISDGDNILFVNFTSAVITQADQTSLEFKYRYRPVNNSGVYNNDAITLLGLEPGSVIQSVDDSDKSNDGDGWRTVKITTFNPTDDVKTQSFTLVDQATGLGRTITLILRNPWQLNDPEEFAGRFTWTYPTETQAAERRGKAGYKTLRYLTVFFNLPDELPEAMFPLTFTVESNRQDIENDPVGNLLVVSGASMFVPGATRIQYEKTVTWREYNEEKTQENPNNTIVTLSDGRKIHRVRCRFVTTTEVPQGVNSLISNVRIRNPYFDQVEVSFERSYGTIFDPITENSTTN